MKSKLVMELDKDGGEPGEKNRIGHEIDGPDAVLMVRLGVAEPADDECLKECERLGLTPEVRAKNLKRVKRIAAGRATGNPRYDAPRKKKRKGEKDDSGAPLGSLESLGDE